MKNKVAKRILSLILSMMLIVAMAFTMTGCGNNNANGKDTQKEAPQSQAPSDSKNESQNDMSSGDEDNSKDDAKNDSEDDTQKYAHSFQFVVVDADGKETSFDIKTNAETVGAALLEKKLIEGEEGQYGLYVTSVNGITADYEKDGTYWAFYINGNYAMSGVDTTGIEDGVTYSFKVEKG